MPSADYDLNFLRSGASQLEAYLLSKDLYWPVGVSAPPGSAPYPQLTLGNLLLAQTRLHARSLDEQQRADLAELDEKVDGVRARWQTAWGRKAAQEFHARLSLWRDFIEEFREHPHANLDRYAYEVNRRAMLELLQEEAIEIPQAEQDMLAGLDKLVQAIFASGDFVWEADLQAGFPKKRYWYLWGKPRVS